MNENFETNSDFTGEPVPQVPVKPARGRELILAAVLLVACLWTANSVIFGGYGLGLALGLWTIMLQPLCTFCPKAGGAGTPSPAWELPCSSPPPFCAAGMLL